MSKFPAAYGGTGFGVCPEVHTIDFFLFILSGYVKISSFIKLTDINNFEFMKFNSLNTTLLVVGLLAVGIGIAAAAYALSPDRIIHLSGSF